ncbi:7-cyano-7-deazaguanine synthase QueC [Endozoicomonas sp. SCSIO W0465]|uniref:7-cyano-7-deazaguanine synthase QueC n=1 Tax=Endozoicomonas sp. SCSIO W0465 TaxID=2918516 RepID=UPI002075EEC3|nr:7-cyano-7-deazaguanine synthase QueC [Endozoicomonas sp. SCSIO W0465]USE34475.1 7-cyano-7-deazaguanine synthase QueC [Endozoicomonas sp. SCSIO W0465]
MNRAVVLLSGGLDSATVLAMALEQGFECYSVSFDYGQRHRSELKASRKVAEALGVNEHKVLTLGLTDIGGSALTDDRVAVPAFSDPLKEAQSQIPLTYVPARNTVFLSIALGWAEVLGARDIFIGANIVDYSNYPDCRPEYLRAFENMANLATRAGVEGHLFRIRAPLLNLTKSEIITEGVKLGVDYGATVSCYQADEYGAACGVCDSCSYRRKGFLEAGVIDPTHYRITV